MALVKFGEGNRERALTRPRLNDVFESFFDDAFISDRIISRVPAVNVSETPTEYNIELAAPGLKKDDFKINIDKNVLSISVEKKTENRDENKKFNKVEYSYSSFVRSFTLPEGADQEKIEAEYLDGVLMIHVAKMEEAMHQPKEIAIK
jgi:HSP20 family protein